MGTRTIMARDLAQGAMRMKPASRLTLRDAVATFSDDHGLTKDRDPMETLRATISTTSPMSPMPEGREPGD